MDITASNVQLWIKQPIEDLELEVSLFLDSVDDGTLLPASGNVWEVLYAFLMVKSSEFAKAINSHQSELEICVTITAILIQLKGELKFSPELAPLLAQALLQLLKHYNK